MTFKSYTEHSEPLFNKLNILSIKKINDFLTSLFMFRYHNLNNLPKYFTNYSVTNNKIHDHNTRNASKLHKSYSRTNYVKHSLCNNGVDIWNKLTYLRRNPKIISCSCIRKYKYYRDSISYMPMHVCSFS